MEKLTPTGLSCWICLFLLFLPGFSSADDVVRDQSGSRKLEGGLVLTVKERLWLQEHPVIRIVNDMNYPPYDFFRGGRPQGFGVEYLQLLAGLGGFQIEWRSTNDWKGALKELENKEVDALHSAGMTEERKDFMLFSTPYLKNLTGLFVRWDNTTIRRAEDLAKAIVAVPKGYSDLAYLRKNYPDCTIVESENPTGALNAVARGQAEVAVLDSGVGNYLAAEHGFTNLRMSNYIFLGNRDREDEFMIGVRDDWPELVTILDKAIASVPAEQVAELRRQWLLDGTQNMAVPTTHHISYVHLLICGLVVVLLLFMLALIVLKFIRAERVSEVFNSKRFRAYVLVGLGFFVLIVVAMGWVALDSLHTKVLQNIEGSLRGGLRIADHALEYWVRDRKTMVRHLGHNQHLLEITRRLLQTPRQQKTLLSSSALADARNFFANDPGVFGNIGFFIIGPDYISLGSRRDNNIGTRNLIAEQRPDLIERAFEGEVLFVPPILSDVQLSTGQENRVKKMPPTMFFMGPIEDDGGDIVAVFTLRVDPTKGFTKSLQVAGEGYSQQTYAFNKEGVLLTSSRFENQLRQIGLLGKDQSSSMQLMLKDPGVNILRGETGPTNRDDLPLTHMAERAIGSREKNRDRKLDSAALLMETNVTGYRDYRGVPVFGAWLWDTYLDVGIAVEIDVDEGISNHRYVRNILFVVLALTLLLSTGATLLVLVLGQRTSKLLARAKDTLEDTVAKRTSELAAAEEHSRLILASMNEGLIEVNTKGQATYVNASALAMLGYNEEEVTGRDIHELIHHSHSDGSLYEADQCPMNMSFSQGIPHNINDEVLWRKDGTSIGVAYSSTPMVRNGVLVGAVIVFQDITERIRAKQEIQVSRDQLQNILDTSPIAVAFSTGGIIHFTNPSFEEQFGAKVGDESPSLYVNSSDREEILTLMQRDGQVTNHEVQMYNKKKEVRDMLISYLGINYDGRDGFLGWLLDITERKKMEAALASERDQLDNIMNTSPVGVAITVGGEYRFANDSWSKLTQLKKGDRAVDAYVDPKSRSRVIKALKKDNKLENFEVQLYGADRNIRDMLLTYYNFVYEGEEGILGWAVDVSDMKKIANELRDQFDDLERFRRLAVGRETRMIELKKEINTLLEQGGDKAKYQIH